MSILCSSLMRFFVVQIFFISEDSVWLVKSSLCVHCCFIRQIYWLGDSCRSEFAIFEDSVWLVKLS